MKKNFNDFNPTMQDLEEIIIPGDLQGLLMINVSAAITEINKQLLANRLAYDEDIEPDHFEVKVTLKLKPNNHNLKDITVTSNCKD